MKLNKWPYWVKGGLLAVVFTIAAGVIFEAVTWKLLSLPVALEFLPELVGNLVSPLFCSAPVAAGGWNIPNLRCIGNVLGALFFAQSFLIGGLLGLLYEKIKNRKAIL